MNDSGIISQAGVVSILALLTEIPSGKAHTSSQVEYHDLSVEVSLVASEKEIRRFLDLLQAEYLDLFYVNFRSSTGFYRSEKTG